MLNHHDLNTDQGFQLEFFWDRCGSGLRTRFKQILTGTVTRVLGAAGGLLGGLFGQAADIGERVPSDSWQRAQDEAFVAAVQEMKPELIQCPPLLRMGLSGQVLEHQAWAVQRLRSRPRGGDGRDTGQPVRGAGVGSPGHAGGR